MLPKRIHEMLNKIEPSHDRDLAYYPCKVVITNGESVDCVYIEPEDLYIKYWGVFPENDSGKRYIWISEIAQVEESPSRLPAQFANELYRSGESGMGYTIFTVVFADGTRQAYGTGNAVDFILYPSGKGQEDVVKVIPHEGRADPNRINAPDWYWCLYSGVNYFG